jgi:hypothetical protein
MKHIMTGEWRLDNTPDMFINVLQVIQYIQFKQIPSQEIQIADISHKELDSIDKAEARYITANINYPVIVVQGMQNPHNKPYRMIDGRHRLLKQINNKTVNAYVLTEQDISKFYQEHKE